VASDKWANMAYFDRVHVAGENFLLCVDMIAL